MTVGDDQSVYFSAQRESQVQTSEGKTSTPDGNNELFPTTAIDGSQDEDSQECGTQGGTDADQQTAELPKKLPYSSQENGKQNCKKQLRKQGEVQSTADPKRSFEGNLEQL